MNREDYQMDFDERREYVYDKAHDVLDNDSDLFVEACEELDSYYDFLGESRCIPMWEIDEFFSKPSELLDKMDDFNPTDEYFYFDAYDNVSTCNYRYDHYSDDFSVDDVLDALIDNYGHVSISDSSLNDLIKILSNEDFGIDYDWTEDDDEEPEETDDEFMERIDSIY